MLVRGRACDRVYNACLGEAFARLERLRADPGFGEAKAMRKGPARTESFAALDEAHGFGESALMSFASSLRNGWVRDLVGAQEAQSEGRNAFRSVQRWSFGKSGKPHFRRRSKRSVLSAECKDLCGDIRPVMDGEGLVGVLWGRGFVVPIATPQSKAEAAEQARVVALIADGGLLYCRVVSRLIGGRWCHEAQFVLDGPAPLRHPVGTESMLTVDTGPSVFHVVYDTGSRHIEIASSVEDMAKELRRQQRHFDRQHRAGSPKCFDEAGRHVQGACHWTNRSKAAKDVQAKIAEAHRVMAARRDSDHGRVANELVAISPNVRTEDHGVKSWQAGLWSKSVQRRGPGAQLVRIERASRRASGSYSEIDSHLALSQTCVCGAKVKKPLSQRRHICEPCRIDLDRDLLSAFLQRHVDTAGECHALDLDAAKAELFGAEPLVSTEWEQDGVPARTPLMRQDIGAGPDEARSGPEKQRVRHRRAPGRRSLVRIRRRREAKSRVTSDSVARLEDGVAAGAVLPAVNQPSPTTRAA